MLKDISSPNDLKKFDIAALEKLAEELRSEIIDSVSKNGGHLSSNLGAVELTIALDYVLEHPKDKIVFDVGHQCYAHKLLTGRREGFERLRRSGGLSGFPSMREYEHDSFTSGHASTSISAALGLCRARDLRGEKSIVAAVIGDGALTGGMSFEALNDAGQSGTDLVVVINDNEMSISRNVGAMSMHLTSMRRSRFYRSFKTSTRSIMAKIPFIGRPLFRFIERLRDIIKTIFIGQNMFDAMGFKYIGPVDGHDIKKLVKALRIAREVGGPVIIHAVTCKGKGYPPAEKEPAKFHGPAPFDKATGRPVNTTQPGCGAAVSAVLTEMAETDCSICAISAAMPTGTGLSGFAAQWPKRFFDVGIAEEHAVTLAGGLAAGGMRPYVAIYSTFLQRAYDQIANDVCMNMMPVTFLIDRAGLVGADGATHNGILDLSYLRSMPGMTIAAPRDVRYLKKLVRWSTGYNKPLAIRYPKDAVDLGIAFDNDMPIVPGKWELLMNGADIALIAVGPMVQTALMAGIALNERGISARIIDAMFVKPIDENMLREIAAEGIPVITIEENAMIGGFGEAVLSALNSFGSVNRVRILGVPDRPIAHGTHDEQLKMCGLDAAAIADAAIQLLQNDM